MRSTKIARFSAITLALALSAPLASVHAASPVKNDACLKLLIELGSNIS